MERSYWASVFFGGGADFPATVRALEERGLTGVEVPQVYGPPFIPLAVAATVTRRIQLATGIAIGRIGCFLTGPSDHTSGTPTALPWGVNFGDGVLRHPTQLYEVLLVILLGAFLWRLVNLPHREGDLFKVFMAGYLGFRLLIDFLKPDVRVGLGLSSIQWACVAMLLYYGNGVWWWLSRWRAPGSAGVRVGPNAMKGRVP